MVRWTGLLGVLIFASMLALPACSSQSEPDNGPPMRIGDYDEGGVWHSETWWNTNRRDWVLQHHPEWLDSYYRH